MEKPRLRSEQKNLHPTVEQKGTLTRPYSAEMKLEVRPNSSIFNNHIEITFLIK